MSMGELTACTAPVDSGQDAEPERLREGTVGRPRRVGGPKPRQVSVCDGNYQRAAPAETNTRLGTVDCLGLQRQMAVAMARADSGPRPSRRV